METGQGKTSQSSSGSHSITYQVTSYRNFQKPWPLMTGRFFANTTIVFVQHSVESVSKFGVPLLLPSLLPSLASQLDISYLVWGYQRDIPIHLVVQTFK